MMLEAVVNNLDKTKKNAMLDERDEVYPRIFMSGYGPAKEWENFEKFSITHVLTVTPYADRHFEKDGVKYLVFEDISDNSEQSIIQYFEQSNAWIKEVLTENDTNKVLVHCAAGISRSGAFICAYMIWDGQMTVMDALKKGRAQRGMFHPNKNFEKQLLVFEQAVLKGATATDELKGAGYMSQQIKRSNSSEKLKSASNLASEEKKKQ